MNLSSKGNVGELHQCLPFVSFQIGTHSYMIFLCDGGVYNVNYHQSPRLFWHVILMNVDSWYFPKSLKKQKGHYMLSTCLLAVVYIQLHSLFPKCPNLQKVASYLGPSQPNHWLVQTHSTHTYWQVHGVRSLHSTPTSSTTIVWSSSLKIVDH